MFVTMIRPPHSYPLLYLFALLIALQSEILLLPLAAAALLYTVLFPVAEFYAFPLTGILARTFNHALEQHRNWQRLL